MGWVVKKLSENIQSTSVIPKILPPQTFKISPLHHSDLIRPFNVFHPQFAHLATKEMFTSLRPMLMEVDIAEELTVLAPNGYLEISVPLNGIVDLLNSKNANQALNFAAVVAINGNGSSALSDPSGCASFIVMTDILGNRYEVVLNEKNELELPKDGTGLFSIPSLLTFIFDYEQVQGNKLSDLTQMGAKRSKCYLLAPTLSNEAFAPILCVCHLDENNRRIVDTIRTLDIRFQFMPLLVQKPSATVQADPTESELLHIDVIPPELEQSGPQTPYTLSLNIEPLEGVNYQFDSWEQNKLSLPTQGWFVHPIHNYVFTKHIGISPRTLKLLTETLYTQYDFMRDYLNGDLFTLTKQNGYNDFVLRPEAFHSFYNLLVHDLVYHRLPADFLLQRLDKKQLQDSDFGDFPVNLHDSVVLAQLQADLSEGRFERLNEFYKVSPASTSPQKEGVSVYAIGLSGRVPKLKIEVTHGALLSQNILDLIDFQQESMQWINEPYSPSETEEDSVVLRLENVLDFKTIHETPSGIHPSSSADLNRAFHKSQYLSGYNLSKTKEVSYDPKSKPPRHST